MGMKPMRQQPLMNPWRRSRISTTLHSISQILIFKLFFVHAKMSIISRHIILVASSAFLLLFIAISLATAIQLRGTSPQVIQINSAQEARLGGDGDVVAAKAHINGTDFDRGDVFNGSTIISGVTLASTIITKTLVSTTMTDTQDGLIGFTPEPQESAHWSAEGVLGPKITPRPSRTPVPAPKPPSLTPQLPILALTYAGAGGPKHCRGRLLQKTYFPPPLEKWKNGTCITLPSDARCGIFFSNKGDNCEAQLFNEADCYNTTETYINTVVFMPEERPVGALWRSMWVRCGVEVPEAKMLDPSILGGALKKPGGGQKGG
jgi:hypothetical protein